MQYLRLLKLKIINFWNSFFLGKTLYCFCALSGELIYEKKFCEICDCLEAAKQHQSVDYSKLS